jgi:hypothetical protein
MSMIVTKRAIAAWSWVTLGVAIQACSGTSESPSGGPVEDAGTDGRTYAPTLTAVYDEILSGSCAQPFCHLGAANPMQLSDQATAYQQLVNAPASGPYCAGMGTRVVPGHPETSLMYLKLTKHPAPCGGSMPGTARPALGARDIQQIQQWIVMGAKND